MKNFFFFIFLFFTCFVKAGGVLTAFAGNDVWLCPHTTTTLNGSATGGKVPYTYHWTPSNLVASPNSATTATTATMSTSYTLTVTDSTGNTAQDVVVVYIDDIQYFGAGPDQGRCFLGGSPVTIGFSGNYQGSYTYNWVPTSDLSNPASPQTLATPSVTTTYTVTITSPGCGIVVDEVTVFVYQVNPDAGPNVTIDEGQTVTLHATGGTQYFWTPNINIKYPNTPDPDVDPTTTQVYLLQALDVHGCSGYDVDTVFVRPSSNLIFYNTFTPNGDGNNDVWVISNLQKYPDNKLEIYNRYGQLVFKKSNYGNDWNGSYFGEELPSGTYFYILDTNTDKGKFKGSVTIIR